MKLHSALKLVRISALPSALADVFGGMALAYALLGPKLEASKVLLLLPATIGVYLGGMALNDILHVRKDGLLRKPRPIVRGEISLKEARLFALALFVGGFICGLLAGAAIWYGLLVLLIVLYDLISAGRVRGVKVVNPPLQAAAGVGVIALCRALHVSIPLLAHAQYEALTAKPLWPLFAGSVFAYFCLVTVVSLFEDSGGGRRALRLVAWLLYPAVLALPAYVLLSPAEAAKPWLAYVPPALLVAALLITVQSKLDVARAEPTAANLGRTVGAGIRGEALLMAAFALFLAADQWWWGLAALACFPLGWLMSRWISPT
jgi:hypothetical protein